MTASTLLDQEMLLATLVTVIAGVVRGYTGFGSGLVMAPLLTLLWGPVEAIAITVAIGAASFLQMGRAAAPLARWREVTPIMAAALVVTPIGTYFLVTLDPDIVKRIIAGAVLAAALVSLRGWTYSGPRGVIPSFVAGAIGALINGVAAVGGPPIVLYIMSLPEDAETHRANIIWAVGVAGSMVLVTVAAAGALTGDTLLRVAILLLPMIAGVWLGGRIFAWLPGEAFRLIILWLLVALSISILVA